MEVKKQVRYILGSPRLLLAVLVPLLITLAALYLGIRYYEFSFGKRPDIPLLYEYPVGPYVQFGPVSGRTIASTSGTMIIWWFEPKKTATPRSLLLSENGDPSWMEPHAERNGGDGKRHEVRLTGLRPSTTYYYTIPGFSEKIFSLTTGPATGSAQPFRFLCIGDTRDAGKRSPSFYREVNERAAAFYAGELRKPAFFLHLGDLVLAGNTLASWKTHFDAEEGRGALIPSMNVYGNHEHHGDFGGNFDYLFSHRRSYSYDYAGAHFLVINTYDPRLPSFAGKLREHVDDEQYAFIEKDLAAHRDRGWIIVSMHAPLLSTGDFNMNEPLIGRLFELFRNYRVDLVLAGHDHHYDSFHVDPEAAWGGTIHIVNGGGGSPLDGFILTRPWKQWRAWKESRFSPDGLYQLDYLTSQYHLYGELSWGFTDVEVGPDTLTVTYYRWLDLERYLTLTGQKPDKWKIIPFSNEAMERNGLKQVVKAHIVTKRRIFTKSGS